MEASGIEFRDTAFDLRALELDLDMFDIVRRGAGGLSGRSVDPSALKTTYAHQPHSQQRPGRSDIAESVVRMSPKQYCRIFKRRVIRERLAS